MFFLIEGFLYMLSAPTFGHIADNIKQPIILSICGNVLMAAALALAGPVPFIPLEPTVPLLYVSCFKRILHFSSK